MASSLSPAIRDSLPQVGHLGTHIVSPMNVTGDLTVSRRRTESKVVIDSWAPV